MWSKINAPSFQKYSLDSNGALWLAGVQSPYIQLKIAWSLLSPVRCSSGPRKHPSQGRHLSCPCAPFECSQVPGSLFYKCKERFHPAAPWKPHSPVRSEEEYTLTIPLLHSPARLSPKNLTNPLPLLRAPFIASYSLKGQGMQTTKASVTSSVNPAV